MSARVSIEDVRRLFAYNPLTGELTRTVKCGGERAGSTVSGVSSTGYITTSVNYCKVKAHRIAFALYYGRWPVGLIDHINGDKLDNRITNLREVGQLENNENRRNPQANSGLGVLGVRLRRGRYTTQIQSAGKSFWIGSFSTVEEASAAYFAAKRNMHKGFVG